MVATYNDITAIVYALLQAKAQDSLLADECRDEFRNALYAGTYLTGEKQVDIPDPVCRTLEDALESIHEKARHSPVASFVSRAMESWKNICWQNS